MSKIASTEEMMEEADRELARIKTAYDRIEKALETDMHYLERRNLINNQKFLMQRYISYGGALTHLIM